MHISAQTPQARGEQAYFNALAAVEAHDGASDPFAAAALAMASMRVMDARDPLIGVRRAALTRALSAAAI